jgi:hypothetical protein
MTTPDPDDATPSRAERAQPAEAAPAALPPATATKRPLIERLGLAVIALGLAALFAVVAVAAFAGGEPFLGVMGAIGMLMVLWVGALTLFRG